MRDRYYRSRYDKEYPKTIVVDFDLICRLLRYLLPYKRVMMISILLLLITKSIEAFVPIYIGKVTQVILNGFALNTSQKLALFADVANAGLKIFILLFFIYSLDVVNVFLKNWVGQKGVYGLRTEAYRHIQQMNLDYYNKHAIGSLMTRVIHDVDQIDQMLSESVIPLIGSGLLFIFISIGLLFVDLKIAFILLFIFPAMYWLMSYFRYNQRRCYDNVRSVVSAMNAFVQEHLMGASTIRSFGLQEQERHYFEEINQDHRNANVESTRYYSFFFAGIDLIQSASLIIVFAILATFASPSTGFEVGSYFTFSLYALMLFRPLADLAERYNVLQSAMAAADRIFHMLDQPTEDYSTKIDDPELKEIQEISFENVWFAYKNEEWILRGFSLKIQKGQTIAIVGMTGAGKTTLLNILMRFYPIQTGSIKINGIDIQKFSIWTVRSQFSVVLQDPEIFSGTISENITMYQPHITPYKVESAIDYVNLRPVVNRFPNGMETYLPERGKSLSSGEQQLISLARAVAHDRSVIILDEATANIDSGTEAVIQNTLQKIFKDKTALVIAHRLSTIKEATKIVVLHQGIAFEVGSHKELLTKKGIYEKLYRLQYI
ncbi:MAG TPA: ABC transporter ATP-binding protein [Waddliaceae bacterium]